AGLLASHAEVKGRWQMTTPSGLFTLSAKADRIDERRDSTWEIIDYKTGGVPGESDIISGLSPQLPLEAAMAAAGAFDGLPKADVTALAHWKLSGGDPAGEIKAVKKDAAILATEAVGGLHSLIDAFAQPGSRYLSVPDADAAPRFSDYGHLARIREWSVSEGEET
ncbi:MAG TPA: PD-(D/E)XK nuclease family protein, partial [Dongiaceae bacterium]